MKIFLCHSSGDKPKVREIYRRLQSDGFVPWFDEEDLLPGQDWRHEIEKAVHESDVVIVCLSRGSISKTGFVHKETKYALDLADEQPEGTIFVIPLKLEECEVPDRLKKWQWLNYFDDLGYERLTRALKARTRQLGLVAAESRSGPVGDPPTTKSPDSSSRPRSGDGKSAGSESKPVDGRSELTSTARTQPHSAADVDGGPENKQPQDAADDRNAKAVPGNIWIPALVFTAACLIFVFVAFFLKTLSSDQRQILNVVFALLAGFATFFVGGTAFVRLTGGLGGIKFLFSGTAGVAIFVFVFSHPIFTSSTQSSSDHQITQSSTPPSSTQSQPQTPNATQTQTLGMSPGGRVKFEVSGSFDLGYSISPGSWVIVDTRNGAEISANITVVGPNKTNEAFSNQAVYQTNTSWGWQRQGSLGGSLDFQDQDRTFVRYTGGVLSHAAYDTPSLGHIITSSNTTLTPIGPQ